MLAIAGTLLLLAPAAFAGVSFTPLLPTGEDPVTVSIVGWSSNGCIPGEPQTVVAGRQITITMTTPDGGCTLSPTRFSDSVRLGPLEPGAYELTVHIVDWYRTSIFETRQLVVSEADPAFVVMPAVVPEGGGEVTIINVSHDLALTTCVSNSCEPVPVFFGDTRVIASEFNDSYLRLTAPPHSSGVVDVAVGDGTGRVVSRAALRYTAAAEEPDRQSFATVLVPMVFNGPGAFGSEWRTDIHVRNNHYVVPIPTARGAGHFCPEASPLANPVLPCRSDIPPGDTVTLNVPDRPRGLLLHLPRTLADSVAFSARVRDISRSEIALGAELPILREKDFRSDSVDFLNIPFSDPRYRVRLRVYVLDTPYAYVSYDIAGPGGIAVRSSVTARREAADEPAFAMVDFPVRPASIDAPTRLQVRVSSLEPFWAFLSITNNETQQVTIVRPQ